MAASHGKLLRNSICLPQSSEPTLADRVVAAHPWKFWGECPGGIRPWRPVVLSPTQVQSRGLSPLCCICFGTTFTVPQFHRTPRAHKQVTAILSPKVDTEVGLKTNTRTLVRACAASITNPLCLPHIQEPYMSELRALGDTEHLSFSTSLFRGPSKVSASVTFASPGWHGLHTLLSITG